MSQAQPMSVNRIGGQLKTIQSKFCMCTMREREKTWETRVQITLFLLINRDFDRVMQRQQSHC